VVQAIGLMAGEAAVNGVAAIAPSAVISCGSCRIDLPGILLEEDDPKPDWFRLNNETIGP
jgi:hypothetical protein